MPTVHEPSRRIYRMWHRGREPDAVYADDIDFPDEVPQIGVILEICYWSDKFARECPGCGDITELKICKKCGGKTYPAPGVFELYRHSCDSHAPVYAPSSKDKDSENYIETHRGSNRIPLILLAYTADMTMKMNDGRKVTQGFTFTTSNATPLYCMQDKKTLIVPWTRRPMIITGAKMRITAAGIHH